MVFRLFIRGNIGHKPNKKVKINPSVLLKLLHSPLFGFWVLMNKWVIFCNNCRNTRSASCPFCRGGLRRVKSEDLWVLTSESEVIDAETVSREELSRFYLYIQSLPKDNPDAPFWIYNDYLI